MRYGDEISLPLLHKQFFPLVFYRRKPIGYYYKKKEGKDHKINTRSPEYSNSGRIRRDQELVKRYLIVKEKDLAQDYKKRHEDPDRFSQDFQARIHNSDPLKVKHIKSIHIII